MRLGGVRRAVSLRSAQKESTPMAHEIHEHDNLMVTGRKAWHSLGTVVEQAPTIEGAMQIAGLDWEVIPAPLYAVIEPKGMPPMRVPAESHIANVRSDTKEVLGIVSDSYSIVQNSQLAELAYAAADDGAMPRVESAGSFRNGRTTFLCCRTDTMMVGGKDPVDTFFSLVNGHDGFQSLEALGHLYRIECANTQRMAQFQASRNGRLFRFRHTPSIQEQIDKIRDLFKAVSGQREKFVEAADALYKKKLTTAELQEFFVDVYQSEFEPIPSAHDESKAAIKRRRKALTTVGAWLENFESPTCTNNGCEGSAWAALNAITEWSDHTRTARNTSSHRNANEARGHSNLFGTSNNLKGAVTKAALALV
tara:strand:- start:1994 stop:3088 length:1095 start_codon:yes stop_codon:yes gene_type:complete